MLPDESVENEIPFFTPVMFSLRDSKEYNEQRRRFTLRLLEQLGMETDERSVCLGTWLVSDGDFDEGVLSFVRNLFSACLIKAHYRSADDIYLEGLPEIGSVSMTKR